MVSKPGFFTLNIAQKCDDKRMTFHFYKNA
jgi:hypothetical protein